MTDVKKSAAEHFAVNPDVEKFHVTSDGQCFKEWHDANEHSKTIGKSEEDRKITIVKRDEVADQIGKGGKESLIDKINACTTVEEVEALIKGNSPKAAKEAAAAKIEELKNA